MINNRYKIIKHLGTGGMGCVYLVEDILFESVRVALKQIDQSRINPRILRSFQNEFRAMTRLKHHNLTQVYDFGFDKLAGVYYITMEYVDGYSLREVHSNQKMVSSDRLLSMFVDLCRALAFIHSRGIVHRDINPGNVMCSRTGKIKLMDFGLVDIEISVQQSKGTIAYMAPEVVKGAADFRTDIFSLGLTFYELLTNEPFYDRSNTHRIIQLLRNKEAFTQYCFTRVTATPATASLKPIFQRMLAFDPEDRFKNCTEIIDTLNTIRSSTVFPFETIQTREAYVRGAEFIGREHELSQLKHPLDLNRTTALWVQGETGVGKSRLFYEFKNWCQLNTITFLEGTCYENVNKQFGPFLPVLSELLLHSTEEFIDHHGPELKKVLPDHPRLVHVTPAPIRDPKTEHTIIIRTMVQCIVETIDRFSYPCVLYLNDVQWGDESSVELIDALLSHAASVEQSCTHFVHLYLSSRTEGIETLEQIAKVHAIDRIQLSVFGARAVEHYITAVFGKNGVGPHLLQSIDQIHAKVGGNPLFLQELIKSLINTETLVRTEQFWDLVKPFDQSNIPKNLEELIITRLNKLDLHEGEMRVLQVIDLLNRSVSWQELNDICSVPSQLLRRLEDAEIVKIKQKESVILYEIAHDLIRNAITKIISDHKAIHAHIAYSLEKIHKEELQHYFEELAYHYYCAECREKALLYMQHSLKQVINNYENKKALTYCDMIVSLLGSDQILQKVDILNQKGNILYYFSGQYTESFDVSQQAITLAQQAQYASGMAVAYRRMAYIANIVDDSSKRAITYLETALQAYESIEDSAGVADTYMLMGYIYYDIDKDYKKALECLHKGMDVAAAADNKKCIGNLLGNTAQVYEATGEFEKSLDCVTKALEMFESEERKSKDFIMKRNFILCIGHKGTCYASMGEYANALQCFEQRITLADMYGITVEKIFGLIKKADTLFALKQFQKAKQCIDSAQSHFDETSDPKAVFMGGVVTARIEYALGNKQRATQILTDLLKDNNNTYKTAKLNYELWRMTKNETYHTRSLTLYRSITQKTKNWLYLQRLKELEENKPSDRVFYPLRVRKDGRNRLPRYNRLFR